MIVRLLQGFRRFAMSATKKPQVVFVLGAPGSGKGTVCQNIADKFGFLHLSAGDLLREEQNTEGSKYGSLIKEHIRTGQIVPVEITCGLLKKAMEQSGKSQFLIDGFPRNKNNVEGWEKVMSNCVELLFMLFLECTEEVCIERCLNRGAAGSGRDDDNMESLRKRFQVYVNDTMPIVEHYSTNNLVRKINSNRDRDEVFEDIDKLFREVQSSK